MHKINALLCSKHDGIIPYDHYTYGEIEDEVVVEGLAMCNDLKLKFQMDKERLQDKRALRDFCE